MKSIKYYKLERTEEKCYYLKMDVIKSEDKIEGKK